MSAVAQAPQAAAFAPRATANVVRDAAGTGLVQAARQIAREVAALHASDVDAKARFPKETIDALKAARLLSAPLPEDRGGAGLGLQQLGVIVSALAEGCASSAMVLAMHYSQLGCLARHGHNAGFDAFIRELALRQWLVASITSEEGTAGDTRRSLCAVQDEGGQFLLEKSGTVGSYCEEADAILVTARASTDAAENDQVLVLVRRGQYELTRTTAWDTLGMRGTCSPGVRLRASAPKDQIFPVPFADISALTMVPYAHILWAAVWTGIAAAAFRKAVGFVRGQVAKLPGARPPGAARLVTLGLGLQALKDAWMAGAIEFDFLVSEGRDAVECASVRWAIRMNNLKIGSSEAAPKLVHEALHTIGVAAYRNDGPYSLGREYRDALSGALMISNDRISAANALLLLASKEA